MSNFDRLQLNVLIALWNAGAVADNPWVHIETVCLSLNINPKLLDSLVQRAYQKQLIDMSLGGYGCVTALGHEMLENHMERTWAEEERLVLEAAVKLTKEKANYQRWVYWNDLEKEVGSLNHSLNDLVNALEAKGFFVHEFDEGVKVGSGGYDFLERQSNKVTGHMTVNTTNNTINAGTNNVNVIGDNNSATLAIQVNPDFQQAIQSVLDLIETSELNALHKEEYHSLMRRIDELSQREQTPEVKELAKSKILTLENGLKASELLLKAAPYMVVSNLLCKCSVLVFLFFLFHVILLVVGAVGTVGKCSSFFHGFHSPGSVSPSAFGLRKRWQSG